MGDSCLLTIQRTEQGYLIQVVGRGTMHASPTARDYVRSATDAGAEVVLDLSACEYLDSTFLGCLVIMHQNAGRDSGSFSVFASEAARERLLHRTGLQHALTFAETMPAVLGEAVTLQISEVEQAEFGRHLCETHERLAELGGPAAAKFRAIAGQLAKELGNVP